ncbi:MAG TPA: DUF3052 family protein [Anaeromyxobacter sp.]
MAGYSGTPLPAKLGLRPGQRLAFSGEPDGFLSSLGTLPGGARVAAGGAFDLAVLFVRSARELESVLAKAQPRLEPAGALWIGWPKKASGVPTNVTEDVVRAAALARGLVDVKVCAIDETWSGLKLVVRLVDRPATARKPARARAAPAASRARRR